jgi:hypothetical protein
MSKQEVATPVTEIEYQEKLAALRGLLEKEDALQWEIGDLIVSMTRNEDAQNTGLRTIAAEVNRTEGTLRTWRNVAIRFPVEVRNYDVPWQAYAYVVNEEEYAEPALELYVEKVTREPPRRAFSTSLLHSCVAEVRQAAEVPPRTLHRPPVELCKRAVVRYHDNLKKGRNIPDPEPAALLLGELESLARTLRKWVNSSNRHGG